MSIKRMQLAKRGHLVGGPASRAVVIESRFASCIRGVSLSCSGGGRDSMIEVGSCTVEEDSVEAKEAVRALLNRLPDDCSMDDVLYHLYVLRAIERGQADVAAGRTLSHEQVEEELRSRWLLGTGE